MAELTPDQVNATKERVVQLRDLMLAQSWPMRADLFRLREKYRPMETVVSQMEDYVR